MTEKIIAVPSMPSNIAGAMTFWRLAGTVAYTRLVEAWEAHGLDPKLLPALPTPATALHRAMEERREQRRLVRPLPKQGGWALVGERVGSTKPLDYEVETTVRLNDDDALVIEPEGSADAPLVMAAYTRHLNTLSLGDVGAWLATRAYTLKAIALRDTGGIYFIPRPSVDTWTEMYHALQDASACVVHAIPALQTGEAVAAVLDAVAIETKKAANEMEEEIKKLKSRGLQARMERCEAVEAKVEFYEDLLGAKAAELHERLKDLKASIAGAILHGSGDALTTEDLASAVR